MTGTYALPKEFLCSDGRVGRLGNFAGDTPPVLTPSTGGRFAFPIKIVSDASSVSKGDRRLYIRKVCRPAPAQRHLEYLL